MTLPAGGALTLAQIHAEFGRGTSLAAYRGVQWWTDAGGTGVFSGGAIAVAEFYAKRATSPVTLGSASYTSPGTYGFTVPLFNTLSVTTHGAGGGGGGNTPGGAGGASAFGVVNGQGGGGGGIISTNPIPGSPGGASGGDTATTGAGTPGGAGGHAQYGDKFGVYDYFGGDGGAGGRAIKTYAAGALAVGSSITVVVGAGGAAGDPGANLANPAPGSDGAVTISWS